MRKGFTLIELLVVVAIIGMLSSVVLSSLNTARANTRDARRYADLRQIANALELYYQANGRYPIQTTWRGTTPGCYGTGSDPNTSIPGLVPTYIPVIPQDPRWVPNSYCYLYVSYAPYQDYKLLAYGTVEGGQVPVSDPKSRYAGCSSGGAAEASYGIASSPTSACW
ncbi:MAG: type II secretion system protein [Patescibacteria group bacterium UBA2103]